MKTDFKNLNYLNDYLQQKVSALSEDTRHTAADSLMATAMEALEQNQTLLETWDPKESMRFIRNVTKLGENADVDLGKRLHTYSEVAVRSLTGVDRKEAIRIYAEIQQIDEELSYEALGKWVSENKIPIKELQLTEPEMIRLAPHLTYLDLTDGKYNIFINKLTDNTFSEEFIENLLKNSHNLSHLVIKNSTISGEALVKSTPPNLLSLEISNCPDFNSDLSALPNLTSLKISRCHDFNRDLSVLTNLTSLKISDCDDFNRDLSALTSLTSLEISNCRAFNRDLSALPNLTSLKISGCGAFNRDLSTLTNLTSLVISRCGSFNSDLSTLTSLTSLEISDCPAFNRDLSTLTSLKSLQISGCDAFNHDLSTLTNLTSLVISDCEAFNRDLSTLTSLTSLEISGCRAFNRDLSALPNLTSLKISGCRAFNRDLSTLTSLTSLEISGFDAFNHDLSTLTNLTSLVISRCDAFNRDLSALTNLTSLTISGCDAFNRDLSALTNLTSLKISRCHDFNRDLSALTSLTSLEISYCRAFNPFDHSLKSLQIYLRFTGVDSVIKQFYDLTPDKKQEIRQTKVDMLGMIDDEVNLKDQSGLSPLDRWLTPPAVSFEKYAGYLQLSPDTKSRNETLSFILEKYDKAGPTERELLDLVWERICERYPRIARGEEDRPELKDFIDQVLADQADGNVSSLLKWEYKMNQQLPMTKEALALIQKWLNDHQEGVKTKIRLALQTHPDFGEIQNAVEEGNLDLAFPDKKTFFQKSPQEQSGLLCRAVVLRERAALSVANKVIKDAVETGFYDKKSLSLLFAIKLFQATGIEGSSKTIERLTAIITSESFDNELKKHAALSLAEVDYDPHSAARKKLLLQALDTDDPILQQALVDSLGKYSFSEEDSGIAKRIISLAEETKDERVKISVAFTLSVIPLEDALKKALEIVESEVWEIVDSGVRGQEKLGRMGSYETYNYRPAFHDTRDNMKRIIAERIVQQSRTALTQQVEERMQGWKEEPESQKNLQSIAQNIKEIAHGLRYVPFHLWLPEGKAVFRGINARKGEELGEAAFIDLLMKGAGSADLSLYDTYDNGTWAKVGQMFTSTTLDYVMGGYFDQDGVLMTIASDKINEMQMRRGIRYQHEGSIHPVSYDRIRNHQISQLFMRIDRKRALEVLAERVESTGRLKSDTNDTIQTVDKIAMRQFHRTVGKAEPMQRKVSYFNPDDSLDMQVREIMQEKGLSEASIDEIVEENVRRQIMREILAESLEDPNLRECMTFAAAVTPAVTLEA